MKGERLERVVLVVQKGEVWPAYFVLTDAGVYQYAESCFVKHRECPKGNQLDMPLECEGQIIVDARGDGESAVLLLENRCLVVFEYLLDPFGKEVQSWPGVIFETPDRWPSWRQDFDEMEPILVTSQS
jgi:hypothetical protein